MWDVDCGRALDRDSSPVWHTPFLATTTLCVVECLEFQCLGSRFLCSLSTHLSFNVPMHSSDSMK